MLLALGEYFSHLHEMGLYTQTQELLSGRGFEEELDFEKTSLRTPTTYIFVSIVKVWLKSTLEDIYGRIAEHKGC